MDNQFGSRTRRCSYWPRLCSSEALSRVRRCNLPARREQDCPCFGSGEGIFAIPRSGQSVFFWIEQLPVKEEMNFFRVSPFVCRVTADLHQSNLAVRSARARVELAFAPNDGLHQRGINAILLRCSDDTLILPMVAPPVVDPLEQTRQRQHDGGNHEPVAEFHLKVLLARIKK